MSKVGVFLKLITMTPKEKAIELFDKMSTNDGDEHHHCTQYVAKQCALIAVDEIIEQMAYMWLHYVNLEEQTEEMQQYWQKVKQEIENL